MKHQFITTATATKSNKNAHVALGLNEFDTPALKRIVNLPSRAKNVEMCMFHLHIVNFVVIYYVRQIQNRKQTNKVWNRRTVLHNCVSVLMNSPNECTYSEVSGSEWLDKKDKKKHNLVSKYKAHVYDLMLNGEYTVCL